jgi:hypothetical protein
MKRTFALVGFCTVLSGLLAVTPARATDIAWTNTAGGNWSTVANWSPNQVPGAADNAVIANNGAYNVTLNGAASVNTLVVGGSSGVQTLALSSGLTIAGNATFNVQGSLNFSGGTLSGPTTILKGTNTWSGGALQAGSTLTVAANGLVLVTGGSPYVYGTLTNAGAIRLVNASLIFSGSGLLGLVNLPGALVDIQSDVVNLSWNSGTEVIVNQGTLRKSGGSGTSYIYPRLNNSGTVDAQSGTLSLNNGNGAGLFLAEAGATLAYTGTYTIHPRSVKYKRARQKANSYQLNESEKQFSFTRVASSTSGHAKKQIPISI